MQSFSKIVKYIDFFLRTVQTQICYKNVCIFFVSLHLFHEKNIFFAEKSFIITFF